MKKIVIFGLGKMFQSFMKLYDNQKAEILAVCDNNIDKYLYLGKKYKIIFPAQIKDSGMDYVVVTSSSFDEIKKQLIELGIDENMIIGYSQVYNRLTDVDVPVMELLKEEFVAALTIQKSENMNSFIKTQEKILFLTAKCYAMHLKDKKIDALEEAEFQVFSQFGEDGIIQWLIHNVELDEKTFVEFGVEDYTEANTKFLLMNNNWTGLVIDGSEENINCLRSWNLLWKYDLTAVAEFITRDNINEIISAAGFGGDIGLLSVDIDGNDYWVLNAITCIKPRIVICEYNNIFGPDEKVSIPYDEKFFRTDKHYSNLYWGASLGAFCDWAERNNYYYIGSNSAGNNAFFVRKDCISKDKIPAKSKEFVSSKYRESRDKNGHLTYLRGKERLEEIKEMELVNIVNGRTETIAGIYQL